jgi:hypothetical protein
LTAQRDAPFFTVASASPSHIAAISNPGGEDLAQCVEQLLKASNSSSDFAVGDLRLVDWDDHSQDPDADACDQPANVEHCDHNAGRLNDAADDEDAACHKNSTTTAKTVRI